MKQISYFERKSVDFHWNLFHWNQKYCTKWYDRPKQPTSVASQRKVFLSVFGLRNLFFLRRWLYLNKPLLLHAKLVSMHTKEHFKSTQIIVIFMNIFTFFFLSLITYTFRYLLSIACVLAFEKNFVQCLKKTLYSWISIILWWICLIDEYSNDRLKLHWILVAFVIIFESLFNMHLRKFYTILRLEFETFLNIPYKMH